MNATTRPPISTPWGTADLTEQIAPGIWQVSTPGHGGIWVAPELRGRLVKQETPYSRGGWFEEDCDWAFVAVSFPEHFAAQLPVARATLKSAYGGEYASLTA
jgi:hypothetical protein